MIDERALALTTEPHSNGFPALLTPMGLIRSDTYYSRLHNYLQLRFRKTCLSVFARDHAGHRPVILSVIDQR